MDHTETLVRGLSQELDHLANVRPNQKWASMPISDNVQDGYRDITMKQFATAVDRMSRWIERTLGVSTTKETMAYLGINDSRYMFMILATQKTGYKILLPSSRNSEEAQFSLLTATQCTKIVHSRETAKVVQRLASQCEGLQLYEAPSLDGFLDLMADETPYVGCATENLSDPAVIIHTSGSTGLPKPITLTNGAIKAIARIGESHECGRAYIFDIFWSGKSVFTSVPWFHIMGLLMIMRSIWAQGPLVLGPPTRPPTGVLALEIIKEAKPQQIFLTPSMLEDMVAESSGLEILATLDHVFCAGAVLSQGVGDRIATVTNMQAMYGSSEAGPIDFYLSPVARDWDYFEWAPHSGAFMEPAGDGLAELVIKRVATIPQKVFCVFPDIDIWRTKDLFEPHPTRPNTWRYKHRNDDVVVLSNGEKFGPVDFEQIVEGHPAVKGALVVGQGHFQAGLLIEPDLSHSGLGEDPSSLIESIMIAVQRANSTAPAHAQVWKSNIAIAKPGKPFLRSPKGNVMRRATTLLYEKEIDALYSTEAFAHELGVLEEGASLGEVTELVQAVMHLTVPDLPGGFAIEDDLFSQGVDSLQVLAIASTINRALPVGAKTVNITAKTVYTNPTIRRLTGAIYEAISGDAETLPILSREQQVSDMVIKYTKDLKPGCEKSASPDRQTIVLTGSTGSLGSYLLEALIADPRTERIYCLNRSVDAEQRQRSGFAGRGINPSLEKVDFIHWVQNKPKLGLSDEMYQQLLDSVTSIVHNAWAVDFNHGLETFERPFVAWTRDVVDFCCLSKFKSRITFVSSIASVGNWHGSGHEGAVPESFWTDPSITLPGGYGESKHVASCILARATEQAGVSASIVRVGQLAGPRCSMGLWNRNEWLPSLVMSSRALGTIPRTLGNFTVIDWVPVDDASQVLIDIVLSSQPKKLLETFHLVNPQTASWKKLVPVVQDFYEQAGSRLQIIEYDEWLNALEQIPITPAEVQRVPALKLLDFFRRLATPYGVPRLATERTETYSRTLQDMKAVDKIMLRHWLRQWAESSA